MKRVLLGLLALIIALPMMGQIVVTEDGAPKSRIVVASKCDICSSAATLLQDFVQRSSGAKLDIVVGKKARSGDIVVGDDLPISVTEDGYRLQSRGGVLYVGGREKGVLYGVMALLEQQLGVDYLAANVYTIDKRATICLPEMDIISNPAFAYRQTQGYGMAEDPIYKMWLRTEEPKEVFAGGLWVHTFDRILSSDEFGESHPEFFSYIRGARRTGRAIQWCLTNDELFEIVAHRVDSIFKANPDQKILSISQNDSSLSYCCCEECQKVNEYEEEPSGAIIRFLNRLAERFPDKEFSTLAYNYSMKPPKHVKPLPNVNIMLCNIYCMREVPLTDNASGREFVEAMERWNEISDNIFVWDYGINFDNYVSPFPNFPVIKPNIELFKRNDVTMHFSQINSSYGGDFSEMKTYMVSKLMWNPHQDPDSLMRHFMDRYYGAAATYIYDYEKLLEGALIASDTPLWIYDTPVSHASGMLNDKCRKRYCELFDLAEAAVEGDDDLLRRVRLSRLPLIYADLEILRTKVDIDIERIKVELDRFERYTSEYKVISLDEKRRSVESYLELYRRRYLVPRAKSLAVGAKIIWGVEPDEKYVAKGESCLTDGLFGGISFSDGWCGWRGRDGNFVVDLGSEVEFSTVEAEFLHSVAGWSLMPNSVEYLISNDGVNFTSIGSTAMEALSGATPEFVPATVVSPSTLSARYIKVSVDALKICPAWHNGVGSPCWFFIDEVCVR